MGETMIVRRVKWYLQDVKREWETEFSIRATRLAERIMAK
jgi:hypothetical protein